MAPEASIRLVAVRVAGGMLMLPAAAVLAMRPGGEEAERCPTLQELVGLRPDRVEPNRVLVLKGRRGEKAVAVPADVAIMDVAAGAVHPLPSLLAAVSAVRGLAALVELEGEVAQVVDPARLF